MSKKNTKKTSAKPKQAATKKVKKSAKKKLEKLQASKGEKRTRGPGKKPKGEPKVPFVVYLTPTLKDGLKKFAAKKKIWMTDFAESVLSRAIGRN